MSDNYNSGAKNANNSDYSTRYNRKKANYGLLLVIPIILIIALCVILLFLFPMSVSGESMTPTLESEQIVFVQRELYSISHGDIVIFISPASKKQVVKRVIGMEGDHLIANASDGKLYRNGEVVSEVYFTYNNGFINNLDIVLKENECFMMGDNGADSLDSRVYGVVEKNSIMGKCLFVK